MKECFPKYLVNYFSVWWCARACMRINNTKKYLSAYIRIDDKPK